MGERRLLERRGDEACGPESKSKDHGKEHEEQKNRRQDGGRPHAEGQGQGGAQGEIAETRLRTKAQAINARRQDEGGQSEIGQGEIRKAQDTAQSAG